eukprot:s473_g32.t1
MALLEALRVPSDGFLAQFSGRLASYLLSGRGAGRKQICLHGSLNGSVVLLPVYSPRRPWRWSSGDMPTGSELSAARLSLLALLATWRAGGTVAPVTPELLEPAKDQEGRWLIPDLRWESREVPDVLQQWQPSLVLGFGALDDVFSRSAGPGGWLRRVQYLRLKLELAEGQSFKGPVAGPAFKNDVALDLSDVAISFANGHQISFEDLLAAVEDPAGHLPIGDEATNLLRLLRLAPRRFPRRRDVAPPRPGRLAPRATEWTAVDALDTTRQGRTLDGEVYYWNRATNETTWQRPWGGRRSAAALGPRPVTTATGARCRSPRERRGARRRLGLSLELVGPQGTIRRQLTES